MSNMYHRVIPRDLFNEAKLLKCLGQLALLHHDNGLLQKCFTVELQYPGTGFDVHQDESSGALFVSNLRVRLKDGTDLMLRTSYNSKDAYPLLAETNDETVRVFNDLGMLSADFCRVIGYKHH